MTAPLAKSSVAAIREDLNAAFKAVAAKHGVDFTLGTIRFNADTMGVKLTGVRRGAGGTSATTTVSPELVALKKKAYLLGATFDETKTYSSPSLGRVRVIGFKAAAKKYPFIVQQVSTGKRYKITSFSAKDIVANGAVA